MAQPHWAGAKHRPRWNPKTRSAQHSPLQGHNLQVQRGTRPVLAPGQCRERLSQASSLQLKRSLRPRPHKAVTLVSTSSTPHHGLGTCAGQSVGGALLPSIGSSLLKQGPPPLYSISPCDFRRAQQIGQLSRGPLLDPSSQWACAVIVCAGRDQHCTTYLQHSQSSQSVSARVPMATIYLALQNQPSSEVSHSRALVGQAKALPSAHTQLRSCNAPAL